MAPASEPDPDAPLLDRIRRGDQDAFRDLIERHQGRVYGMVMRTLHCDRHFAADMSQEVFLRVHRGLSGFDGSSRFVCWLNTIVLNQCITEIRKRRSLKRGRTTLSLNQPVGGDDDAPMPDPAADGPGPSDRVHHREIAHSVRAAVVQLPPDFQQAVLLRDLQGLSYEEIAEVLEVPPGTVRSRIHRGRLLLQAMLEELRP